MTMGLGVAGAEPPGEVVPLTRDGQTVWRVFVPTGAGPVERFAASELARYFEKICGARLEDTPRSGEPHTIQLGLRSALSGGANLPPPKSGYDGYAISVRPDGIVVAGDNPPGVLYAVYDLLERLGCRWYQPALDAKDPEVVPRSSRPTLSTGSWAQASPIEFRLCNASSLLFEIIPDRLLPQIDWAAKNRYNALSWQAHHAPGRVASEIQQMADCGALDEMAKRGLILHGPGHCFPFFLPTEKYFEAHPEWFGLKDGRRRKHGGEWPLMNFCWSNPDACAEFIRNAETFVKQWPQLKMLYMVGIDGGSVCECPNCRARGASDLVVDLFNRLSDRLATTASDVLVETVIGYGLLEKPPHEARPNGRWRGLYAHWGRNHRQSYDDPDYVNKANLETWTSLFPRYTVCSYYAAASHQPFNGPPFLHALEGDTKYLVEHGASGHLTLQYPHGFWWNFSFNLAAAGQYAYYYPGRLPRNQLRDYAMTYFGPKAGPVLAEYLEKLGANEHLETSYRAGRGEASSADMHWLAAMSEMIRRAASLVEGDTDHAYRVSKLAAGMNVLLRLGPGRQKVLEAEQRVADYQQGKCRRADVEQGIADARAFVADWMSLVGNVDASTPGVVAPDWFEGWLLGRTFSGPLDRLEKTVAASGPTSQPATRPVTRVVPIGEGWARNKVNATIFRQHAVTTFGDTQYTVFYNAQGQVVLAKRKVSSTHWDTRVTQYSGNVRDAHNTISLAVDGRGILHMSWDHHGHPLRYVQSTAPGSLELTDKMPMTGKHETHVTYPEFFNLDDGGLLFLYRDGGSGRGNTMLNRFDARTGKWSVIQHPLISGEGQRNAYTNQIAIDSRGVWHISWNWRETGDVATNHDLCYAKSADGGQTWMKSTGEKYDLPITQTNAEVVRRIPQKQELSNTTSTVVDSRGRPMFANSWREPGQDVPQYYLVWYDGKQWRTSQIGGRTTSYRLSGGGTKRKPASRPKLAVDSHDRVFMFFRDADRGERVSVAICDDPGRKRWRFLDLTDKPVDVWEPCYDTLLWRCDGVFHLFLQRVGQGDGEKLVDMPPQTVSILEWKPDMP